MEVFYEYMVKGKRTGKDKLCNVLYVMAGVILTLLTFLFLTRFLGGFEFLIIFGIWFGVRYLIKQSNLEYEYILTNNILDVDKVIAKERRKRITSVDFKNIEECKPFGGNTDSLGNVKIIDATGEINTHGIYCVRFSKSAEIIVLLFTPDEKLLNHLKTINPRNVVTDAEGTV